MNISIIIFYVSMLFINAESVYASAGQEKSKFDLKDSKGLVEKQILVPKDIAQYFISCARIVNNHTIIEQWITQKPENKDAFFDDENRENVLMQLVTHKLEYKAIYLLDLGANARAKNSSGKTALDIALIHTEYYVGRTQSTIIDRLIRAMIDQKEPLSALLDRVVSLEKAREGVISLEMAKQQEKDKTACEGRQQHYLHRQKEARRWAAEFSLVSRWRGQGYQQSRIQEELERDAERESRYLQEERKKIEEFEPYLLKPYIPEIYHPMFFYRPIDRNIQHAKTILKKLMVQEFTKDFENAAKQFLDKLATLSSKIKTRSNPRKHH